MWQCKLSTIFYTGVVCLTLIDHVNAEDCWKIASSQYDVPVRVLKAIAKVESDNKPDAYEQLEDSESIGLMQVNSFWYGQLEGIGIQRNDLWEPCINISVGAWILSQEINRYGYNWKAIGAYNAGAFTSRNKERKLKLYARYAEKVYRELQHAKQAE